MKLLRLLQSLAQFIGLTEEKYTSQSELMSELGTVRYKKHTPEDDWSGVGLPLKIPGGNRIILDVGSSLSEDEKYEIRFEGRRVSFTSYDKGVYGSFSLYEPVRIFFREVYESICDYAPPDFTNKQLLRNVLTGYRVERIEKI